MKKNPNKEEMQWIANIIRDGAIALSIYEKKSVRRKAVINLKKNAELLTGKYL